MLFSLFVAKRAQRFWRLRARACSDAGWNIDPLPARQDDVARDHAQLPFLAAVSLNHIKPPRQTAG